MKNRMTRLLALIALTFSLTLFAPRLDVQPDLSGADITFVDEAFAEGGDPAPEPKPNDPKPKNPKNPANNDDDDPEPEPEPDPDPDPEPEPDPTPKSKHHDPKDDDPGFDPDEYVSKAEYQQLKKQMDDLSGKQQERVVQSRVQHAIDEQYVDGSDEDAVAEVRKIAGNDQAWESYKKVAKPRQPDHITARKFQNKNVKSLKHTGNSQIMDKVLEHQKT